MIGIAIYSRGVTLANEKFYDVGAKVKGPSFPRWYTRKYGKTSYYEVRNYNYCQTDTRSGYCRLFVNLIIPDNANIMI